MQLGNSGRREASADGLVQQDLNGAALDVERVVVEALLPPHPSAARGVVERALGRVPTLGAAEVLQPQPLLGVAKRALVAHRSGRAAVFGAAPPHVLVLGDG